MNISKTDALDLLSKIKIVKILSFKKNENSDHLFVVQIDTGDTTKQIVTGANNFKDGDLVPFLGVGEIVPGFLFSKGEKVVLEARPLRGYVSEGMILAEDEIGLSDEHEGIMIIQGDDSLIGKSILEVLSEEQIKQIMDRAGIIEITPELQRRIDLIMSIAENGGEVIGADELPRILTSGEELFTYDGFEPSGQMHIAQGIIRAINTNKMIDAGFTFKMWVADWFGYLNNKMGGDMEKIQKVGKYFIEIWRASGMDLDGVQFLWTSDFIDKREYWELVMKVAKSASLKRILKTTEIMGRSETDDLTGAQIIYPCMQITDIFLVMKCQVTQLGMDQRKVNMLAREIGPELGFWKPVVVSQGMLQGLQKPAGTKVKETIVLSEKNKKSEFMNAVFEIVDWSKDFPKVNIHDKYSGADNLIPENVFEIMPAGVSGTTIYSFEVDRDKREVKLEVGRFDIDPSQRLISMKMSKSKPETAIFMTDTPEEVERKIMKAYCPEGETEDNPILAYCKQIIFQSHFLKREKPVLENGMFIVERDEKFGGNVSYSAYEELERDYVDKKLFPLDLKNAVVKYLNEILRPVREHFENNQEAKKLLEEVKGFQVTR